MFNSPMALAIVGAMAGRPLTPRRKEKKKRPCLHCGKQHDHNNAFCSPECCKVHREVKNGE